MNLSLNLNSDLSVKHFMEGARLAESRGYARIWIGETLSFGHSFPFLSSAAYATRRIHIGAGILSPHLNRCHHICKAFQTLVEAYGDRFAVALAPGDAQMMKSAGAAAAEPVETVLECAEEVRRLLDKKGWHLPVYVGASGPRLIAEGSLKADGVLLNYIHPEHVGWAMRKIKRKTYVASYGPALLLPDAENEHYLEAAATVVLAGANRSFLREFNLEEYAVKARKALEEGKPSIRGLKLPLEKFSLAVNLAEMKARLKELADLGVDEVILATPMCRNLASVEALGKAGGI